MSDDDNIAFSELAEVNPRVSLQAYADDTVVSFIPMSDVSEGGKWTIRQERRLGDVRLGYTAFLESDLLFAKITPCMENGKGAHPTGLKNGIGCGSTEFHVLRAKSETSARYLHHWLQATTTRTKAIAYMGGSAGQQRVQAQFFDRYRVPRLSPTAQCQAATILDQADEAIAKTEAVIAKLRQVRTGLIHDLLTCGLDENGHLRDPIAHPDQFHETNLGLLPIAWEVVALGTALSMQAGSGLTGEDINESGYYPVYGGNGQRGFTSRFTHEGRFVLIGRQGALCGNIAVASGQFFATEHAIVCTPVRPISAGWLACYLERMNLNRFSEASAQPGLSVQKISYKQIALPSLDEQVLIETRIDELDKLIESETAEFQKLTQLKSGLMDDLLTGRVRVPEATP